MALIRAALLLAWIAISGARAEDDFILGLPYGSHPAQRLNLYMTAGKNDAPLLIYLPGGFWGALDERFRVLADGSSKLRFEGVAVAILRTRTATEAPWPASRQDAAAAIAMLKREARRYRIDPRRIFLMGHSSGGFTASRLALEQDTAGSLAGVITLSGLHHLGGPAYQGRIAQFIDGAFKEKPSASVPKSVQGRFLILAGEKDLDGFARDAQAFALALKNAGAKVIYQTVLGGNHQSVADLGAPDNAFTRELLLDFTGAKSMSESLRLLVAADQHLFFSAPLSSESLWRKYSDLIQPFPIDERFEGFLAAHILEHRYQLAALPMKTYHAIPVAELIKTLPGKGPWLRTVNTRNENYYWYGNDSSFSKPSPRAWWA
ncbi:MAG: alpha/beta hydrolase [Burkholderiales bacterium]